MSSDDALERFRELVRIPTISRLDPADTDWSQFDTFLSTLRRLYPRVHASLEREVVGEHSLLFRWAGRGSSDPTVLMAHYDVVAATPVGWEYPPFAAELTGSGEDQVLWGRGTIDDKGSLVALIEAIELQLETGQVPANDIYLAFGHDEETNGTGALAIAQLLEQRGVRPALVLDEGGAVVEGFLPGVTGSIAAIGVAEKGTTLVKLVVDQPGGHASTPARSSAIVRLSEAIARLNSHPFPARFNRTTLGVLRIAGDHATGVYRFVFRTLWLTRPLLLRMFARRSDETSAMVRTTQAVTILEAGHAANALPERATAVVNLRVAVGSTVAAAVARLTRSIADPHVQVEVMHAGEPSPVSPTTGAGWEMLRATVESVYPSAIITPYVQNGATDSRQFTGIAKSIYRFTPFELSQGERDALHAVNERIHVSTFHRGIEFYRALVARL